MLKSLVLVGALSGLLGTAQVSEAVDLQAGWYVKLGSGMLSGIDPIYQRPNTVDWNFVGSLGAFGPFEVTYQSWQEQRVVTVPTSVSGVAPGTSIWLWAEPSDPVYWPISLVGVRWETNYQADRMILELYKYSTSGVYTLLWAQNRSGYNHYHGNLLGQWEEIEIGSIPVFRVRVVPEANTCAALLIPSLLVILKRRKC